MGKVAQLTAVSSDGAANMPMNLQLDHAQCAAVVALIEVGLRVDKHSDGTAYRRQVNRMMQALGGHQKFEAFRTRVNELLGKHSDAFEAIGMAKRALSGATVEMEKHRRGIAIVRMAKRNKLDEGHLRAAGEIKAVIQARSQSACAQTSSLEEKVDTSRRPSTGHQASSEVLLIDERKRFALWADEVLAKQLPYLAILAVVANDQPIREAETDQGLRNGSLESAIVQALDIYKLRAGWASMDARLTD